MARRKFVCGNWKMHKTSAEARAFVKELRLLVEPLAVCRGVVLAPRGLDRDDGRDPGAPPEPRTEIGRPETTVQVEGRIAESVRRLDSVGLGEMVERVGDLRDEGQPFLPRIGESRRQRVAHLRLEVRARPLALVEPTPVERDVKTVFRVEPLSERGKDRIAASTHRAGEGPRGQDEAQNREYERREGARAPRAV